MNSGGGTNTFSIVTSEDFDGDIVPNGGAANDVLTGLNSITLASGQTGTFAGEQLTGLTLTVTGVAGGAAEQRRHLRTTGTLHRDDLAVRDFTMFGM